MKLPLMGIAYQDEKGWKSPRPSSNRHFFEQSFSSGKRIVDQPSPRSRHIQCTKSKYEIPSLGIIQAKLYELEQLAPDRAAGCYPYSPPFLPSPKSSPRNHRALLPSANSSPRNHHAFLPNPNSSPRNHAASSFSSNIPGSALSIRAKVNYVAGVSPSQVNKLAPLQLVLKAGNDENPTIYAAGMGKPSQLRGGSPQPTPGPGTYHLKPRPTSPAFSMGSKLYDNKKASPTPGPGSHNLPPALLTGPSISFSPRLDRVTSNKSEAPGPGSHNMPSTLSGPSFTTSPRLKGNVPGWSSPGPGHYKFTDDKPSGPSFTMLGRFYEAPVKKDRGPSSVTSSSFKSSMLEARGLRNVHATDPGHCGYHLSRDQVEEAQDGAAQVGKDETDRNDVKEELEEFKVKITPGGASYKVTPTGTFLLGSPTASPTSLSPRASFLKHRPKPRKVTDPGPGPGAHQSLDFVTVGPSTTIKSRVKQPETDNFPGPGTYDVRMRPSSPAFSLGSRVPLGVSNSQKPGPGAYTIASKPDGPSFSIIGRPKDPPSRSRSPGPGAYVVKTGTIGSDLPRFTFTGKPKEPLYAYATDLPGPGAYKLPSPRSGAFSITSRVPEPPKANADVPGPRTYKPDGSTSKPSFTIRGKLPKQADDRSSTPGPGTYSPRLAPDGRAFSLLGKLQEPPSSGRLTPGPGAYNVGPRSNSPAFSILCPVKPRKREDSPGPGAYSPRSISSGPSFGLKGRIYSHKKDDLPGPGAYNPHSGRSSPAFSILGKTNTARDSSSSPGPGQYSVASPRNSPSFSIYGRIASTKKNHVPGPGTYEQHSDRSSPAFSILGKLSSPERSRSPGPGDYSLPSPRTSTAFSMYGRIPDRSLDKVNGVPGPGAYSPQTGRNSPAFSIKGKLNSSRDRSTSPGPGEYTLPVTRDCPAFSMYGRIKRPNNRAPTPGPGAYEPSLMDTSLKFSFGAK